MQKCFDGMYTNIFHSFASVPIDDHLKLLECVEFFEGLICRYLVQLFIDLLI